MLEPLEAALLPLVVAAAVAGVLAPSPARFLVDRRAIEVTLAVLVVASALTVPAGSLRRLRSDAGPLALVLAVSTVVLPLLAYALSRLLTPPELQDAVLAVGVAPAEVASLAVASIAAGEVAVAAALLVASTLVSVLVAGPVLSALAGTGVSPVGVLVTLAVVVGVPMVLGLAARRPVALWSGGADAAGAVAVVAVVVLVWLVSSQVELSARDLRRPRHRLGRPGRPLQSGPPGQPRGMTW